MYLFFKIFSHSPKSNVDILVYSFTCWFKDEVMWYFIFSKLIIKSSKLPFIKLFKEESITLEIIAKSISLINSCCSILLILYKIFFLLKSSIKFIVCSVDSSDIVACSIEFAGFFVCSVESSDIVICSVESPGFVICFIESAGIVACSEEYVNVVVCSVKCVVIGSVESTSIVVCSIDSGRCKFMLILKIKSFSYNIGEVLLQYLFVLVSSGQFLKADIFNFTSVKFTFASLSPNL